MILRKDIGKKFLFTMIFMLLLSVYTHGATAFAVEEEPVLDAVSATVLDYRTDTAVYKKNVNKIYEIGAFTNIMTVLVAAEKLQESGKDLSDNALEHFKKILEENNSESINYIVEKTYGNEEKFLAAMNKKADKLKLKKTIFVSVYANAKNNETVSSEEFKSPDRNCSTIAETGKITAAFLNNNQLKSLVNATIEKGNIKYGVIVQGDGSKTGICSAIYCESDTSSFVMLSVTGAEVDLNMEESVEMLEYICGSYRTYQVLSKGKSAGRIKVKGGEKSYVKVYAKEDLFVTLPKEGEDSLVKTEIVLDGDIVAPVKKNTVVGKVQALEAGEVTAEVDIIIKEDVREGGPWSKIGISDYMMKGAGAVIGTLFLLFIIMRIRIRRKKKRIAEMKRRKRKAEAMRIAMERAEKRKRDWPY